MTTSKRAVERAQRGLPEPPRCTAHKKDGTPCGRWPVKGATVCPKHGGAAPQVRKKAQERLFAAADVLMAQLLKIATSAESEAVRLTATKDALDRAGFGAAQLHKLTVTASPWDELLESVMDDDVLVRVSDAEASALPARRGGGGLPQFPNFKDDDAYDYDAEAVRDEYDEPEPRVIPGEVVHERPTPTPKQAQAARRTTARGRERLFTNVADDEIDRTEYADVAPSYGAADDAATPPAYVREAMESEGKDWRTGERLKVRWTG